MAPGELRNKKEGKGSLRIGEEFRGKSITIDVSLFDGPLKMKEAIMESQVELEKNRVKYRDHLAQHLPNVFGPLRSLMAEVYKDGVLSGKVKRLMSLALALGAGCRNCILAQTMYALENGATKEEILETISVVLSMRGTTGVAESLRVVQLLDELGEL
jgi:AhpD family alkylhydroperoxidase